MPKIPVKMQQIERFTTFIQDDNGERYSKVWRDDSDGRYYFVSGSYQYGVDRGEVCDTLSQLRSLMGDLRHWVRSRV